MPTCLSSIARHRKRRGLELEPKELGSRVARESNRCRPWPVADADTAVRGVFVVGWSDDFKKRRCQVPACAGGCYRGMRPYASQLCDARPRHRSCRSSPLAGQCMTVRRVINMLSFRLHYALGAPASCRVAQSHGTPAAAAARVFNSATRHPSGLGFKRSVVASATSNWRDASALAATLDRKHGVRRRKPDVTTAAGKTSGGKTQKNQKGSAKDAPRPGRKGVGPPARRGGKKKQQPVVEVTSQDDDDFDEQDVDDELSAFNDDDTGDYEPRKTSIEKKPIVGEFNDDDDWREDSRNNELAVGTDDGEQEFVFLRDDEEEGDFDDDDGLFLTDADDSLTKQTAQQAKGVSVKSCKYLQSCVRVKDCPPPLYPEIAVIGRSNVGKSSLINMLTGRTKKEVAKTSKNPGKTQTINHFEMVTGDGTWYLTDLPGYGFANAPEKARKQWALFTREYLLERENLLAVMLLIDSTIKPQQLDLECLEFLGENDVPVTIVFTKVDKKRKIKAGKRARPEENVEMFCREVSEYWEEMPPMIFTSSKSGDGKQSVLNHVATLRQFFKEGQRGKR